MRKDNSPHKSKIKIDMNHSKRVFGFFCLLSAALWLFPFLISILFIDFRDTIDIENLPEVLDHQTHDIISRLIRQLDEGDKFSAFNSIFWNNLKVCITNIVGGALLGIVTIISLLQNGLFTGNVVSNVYHNGMTVREILKHTLPHSVELLGTWLSGAIGFSFAKIIIDYTQDKGMPDKNYIKFLGTNALVVLFITLIAAFMEVYVSMLK